MKIAVTGQNFRTVTPHAGRARRFLVYEARAGEEPVEVDRLDLPKELAMHEWHGGGAHPLDAVDVLIAGSFGEGFARRMAARGVVAVTMEKTDPVKAVKDYLAGAEGPSSADGRMRGCHRPGHRGHPSDEPTAEHGCCQAHPRQHQHRQMHQHGHQHGGQCHHEEEDS